jgi:Ca2+-binding RTX toxin-like protein
MLGRLAASLTLAAALAAPAWADHIPGHACDNCSSHEHWPSIDGDFRKAKATGEPVHYVGTERSDELLGHHGSDYLHGKQRSDVLWGDWKGGADQPTNQRDEIRGGGGEDFIYGSHGRNVVYGGKGNDAISVHFGRGYVNCGPGRDIYHVAKSRRDGYKFRNCEKVDYRSESGRGGGLEPLP